MPADINHGNKINGYVFRWTSWQAMGDDFWLWVSFRETIAY